MHLAVDAGSDGCVEALLNHAPDLASTEDSSGETPLALAARRGFDNCLRVLLSSSGIRPQPQQAMDLLRTAIIYDHVGCARVLLELTGAEEAVAADGETVAHLASLHGASDILKLIASTNPQVCQKPNFRLDTPLHLAVAEGNETCAMVLLETLSTTGLFFQSFWSCQAHLAVFN